ncbi:hypothetical protein [Sphingomonas sp. PB4P5]|uniref:hypothetical protein n=1 Tax=Parasphingomonas puruogangriensis TaxID=3096155 RepID=UPI002FC61825
MTAPTPPASPAVEIMARLLCDDPGSRAIADESEAPSFDDSRWEVQTYWRTLAAAALAAPPTPRGEGKCSCMEAHGEDPRCIKHGRGTPWAKANPDICDLAEKAARVPALEAELAALSTPRGKIGGEDHFAAAGKPIAEIGDDARAIERMADAMAANTASETMFLRGDNKAGWEELALAAFAAATPAPAVGDGEGRLIRMGELFYHADGFTEMAKRGDLSPPAPWIKEQLEAEHTGDCTKQPWSCMRCHAEDMMVVARYVDQHMPLAATPASVTPDAGETYRHKKRGTLYEMIGTAELQASQPRCEHAELAIYRGEDGKLWARNTGEFHDGRFERLTAALTRPAEGEDRE